ncbi:spore germination protein [Paenibacillus sp. N1-5-1-14]|uniref:spore germination protein n=1 Tax=Paenibacillus radicibacter TaxID=2972488 RepID=UPI0021593993|nr:spore germination protein [Paenibacillus radicibacter]MCR8643501.1 spore germination protein [Paenibacillus radicibacter]
MTQALHHLDPLNAVNPENLRAFISNCADVKMQSYKLGSSVDPAQVILLYCEGQVDGRQLNQFVLPKLEEMFTRLTASNELDLNTLMPLQRISHEQNVDELMSALFSGQLIIYLVDGSDFYTLDIAAPPHRQPSESNTDVSLKGPKDGFTEEITTNIALIRKRIQSQSLSNESFVIGRRSQTKVALLYMKDIVNPDMLNEMRTRLKKIDMDFLLSTDQLEEALGDSTYSLFPLLDYIGRPDYVVESLMNGRMCIIINGCPMVVLGPANLTYLLKSPEDIHFPYFFVFFERILRLIGLFVAIFMPGFWVSVVSYNVDQIPFPLLATVANSRLGLPMPAPLEMCLLLLLFELFREAGARLPKAIGQTVAVVGGLIVGDATIRAGLSSPSTLVAAAVTAVCTFTLVNQSISGTVSIVRIVVLALSSVFGLYGFFIALLAITLYLSTLESFGVPYLSPISPPVFKDMIAALFKKTDKNKQRPEMLNLQDQTRSGEESS